MQEAVARDILVQYFKVIKKDLEAVQKPDAVKQAEDILGPEVVQEIRESILG